MHRCPVGLFILILVLPLAAQETVTATSPFHVDTYTAYEKRIQRIESIWPDVRAVTTRQADGNFTAVLVDREGNELAQRWVSAPDPVVRVDAVPGAIPGEGSVSRLNEELEREYRLRVPSTQRTPVSRMPNRVTLDFGTFIGESVRDPMVPMRARQQGTAYSTFHTVLRDKETSEQVGIVRWFANEEVLVWNFPRYGALGYGWASPERLSKVGGWKFTPDMVWTGIQALVFHESYGRVDARRKITTSSSFEVTPQNCDGLSDGCTGMHWLDGTVLRACCDTHDLCYEFSPPDGCCTAWSWIWPYSWRCVACNINVVLCFFLGGGGGGGGGGWGGGGGGGGADCYITCGACWCPAECRACERDPWVY